MTVRHLKNYIVLNDSKFQNNQLSDGIRNDVLHDKKKQFVHRNTTPEKVLGPV